MHRRIDIDNLRSSDPATVQVLAEDALRRPLGQIGPGTLLDLFALSEVEELPKGLARALQSFAERITREIADLPNGKPFKEFLDEISLQPHERIPATLRQAIRAEWERDAREQADKDLANAHLEAWSLVGPDVIALPTQSTAPVQQEPAEDAPTEKKRARTPRAPKKKPTGMEPERENFIRQMILERLSGYGESGLAEQILIAGLMHRGKTTYADISPFQIMTVLKDLKASGQLKLSVGRWKLVSRW